MGQVADRIHGGRFDALDDELVEYVQNISRTGAFIRSRDPLPVGTKVSLRFTVLMDEIETIEGVGQVVRVVLPNRGEPSGMGVVFIELSSVSRQLVEKILVRR